VSVMKRNKEVLLNLSFRRLVAKVQAQPRSPSSHNVPPPYCRGRMVISVAERWTFIISVAGGNREDSGVLGKTSLKGELVVQVGRPEP